MVNFTTEGVSARQCYTQLVFRRYGPYVTLLLTASNVLYYSVALRPSAKYINALVNVKVYFSVAQE